MGGFSDGKWCLRLDLHQHCPPSQDGDSFCWSTQAKWSRMSVLPRPKPRYKGGVRAGGIGKSVFGFFDIDVDLAPLFAVATVSVFDDIKRRRLNRHLQDW